MRPSIHTDVEQHLALLGFLVASRPHFLVELPEKNKSNKKRKIKTSIKKF
jgi:hypothetical protein